MSAATFQMQESDSVTLPVDIQKYLQHTLRLDVEVSVLKGCVVVQSKADLTWYHVAIIGAFIAGHRTKS